MKKILLSVLLVVLISFVGIPQRMHDKPNKHRGKLEQLEKIKLIDALELDEETEWDIWQELIEDLANPKRKHEDVYQCLSFFGARFKKFDCNIMALGYPKSSDNERILKLEHKGIEIRTGNPEWGAEPNKLYFVIMHGAILA